MVHTRQIVYLEALQLTSYIIALMPPFLLPLSLFTGIRDNAFTIQQILAATVAHVYSNQGLLL
jgi:hypothetical protein